MIAAIIVLFEPDLSILEAALISVSVQTDVVYLIDNTEESSLGVEALLAKVGRNPRYFKLGANRGLAAAQNIGIRECIKDGHSHVLLLDQDSIPPNDLVEKLLQAEETLVALGRQVAAVGPVSVDRKSGSLSRAIRYGWFRARTFQIEPSNPDSIESDWLISSGSLIRLSVFAFVGTMNEALFIDWVDAEWGLRAKKMGLQCFISSRAVMEHSIGDESRDFFGRRFNLHSITRNYYAVRNSTYLLKPKVMGWKWVTAMAVRIPRYIVVHTWFSKSPWRSFRVMAIGVIDGIRGHLGPNLSKD
jgi:rhamnosyltransferase